LSFEKFLELDGVYHVPRIRKILTSISLLDRQGYNVNFGSNKVVISRHGQFVGKGLLLDGLYRLSVMGSSSNAIFDSQLSVANIECSHAWHCRLGYLNKNINKKMMHLDLIPKLHVNMNDTYQSMWRLNN